LIVFFEAIRDALGRSDIEHAKSMVVDFENYWRALAPLAEFSADVIHPGWRESTFARVGKAFSAFLRELRSASRPSPQVTRAEIERKVDKAKLALVVLIDELDRVEDHDVREIAKLIKSIADFRKISYLVAYDAERVAEALGGGSSNSQRQRGEAYLEKIISHSIPIRPLFQHDIDILLNSFLRNREGAALSPQIEWQKRTLETIKKQIRTPRDVKRLEGTYMVLNRAVHDEVCRFDLLAYCWIMTKAPTIQRRIAEVHERLVEEPTTEELSRRMIDRLNKTPEPTPESELGEEAKAHSEILALLFPRLQSGSRRDDTDGTRICVRRNLRRVLYLGYPPDMIQRGTLERVWQTADFDFLSGIAKSSRQNSLLLLLERLEDVVATLDPNYDSSFWVALSREFIRQTDWVTGPDSRRDLAEYAATILRRLAMLDDASRKRVRVILDALITNGDLAISPIFVRKHIFGYDLGTIKARRTEKGLIWDEEEFKILLTDELGRYRHAIRDGSLLRRCPSFEPGFALLNVGEFDAELRQELTAQLNSTEAVLALAVLLVPPGFSMAPDSLATLVDFTVLKTTLERLGAPETWEIDPYLRESARRLVALLEGKDLTFFGR
jgi:hypothetical protein